MSINKEDVLRPGLAVRVLNEPPKPKYNYCADCKHMIPIKGKTSLLPPEHEQCAAKLNPVTKEPITCVEVRKMTSQFTYDQRVLHCTDYEAKQ